MMLSFPPLFPVVAAAVLTAVTKGKICNFYFYLLGGSFIRRDGI